MTSQLRVVLVAAVLWSSTSAAGPSCLPSYNSLQVLETVDTDASVAFSYRLRSENAAGLFETRVFLSGGLQNRELNLRAHFDETFDGVSLPYNLYAVAVLQDGRVIHYVDFTQACQDAGLSFFPGQGVQLHPVSLQGSGPSRLQIVVWGRL